MAFDAKEALAGPARISPGVSTPGFSPLAQITKAFHEKSGVVPHLSVWMTLAVGGETFSIAQEVSKVKRARLR
eukprot:9925947-Lingulodinium_polyedra.AAC.1